MLLVHWEKSEIGLENLTSKEYKHKDKVDPIHLHLVCPRNCKIKGIPKGNVFFLSHKH